MAQVLVNADLSYSTKLLMDSKKAEQLLQLVSEATLVRDRYDGYMIPEDNQHPEVEIRSVANRKLVSQQRYEEIKAEEELAKAQAEGREPL